MRHLTKGPMRLPNGIPLLTLVLPVLFLSLNRVCSESSDNGSSVEIAPSDAQAPHAGETNESTSEEASPSVAEQAPQEGEPVIPKVIWSVSKADAESEAGAEPVSTGKRAMGKQGEALAQESEPAAPPGEEDIQGWQTREQELKRQIQAAALADKETGEGLTRDQILELVRERVDVSRKLRAVQNP